MNKRFALNPKLSVYMPVAAVALIVRALLFQRWLASPLRYYYTIRGLDMTKLLRFGREFAHGETPFSLYKMMLAAVLQVSGHAAYPETVVAVQLALGAATSVLVAY
ncbi:MAG: hypothetical protein K9N51_07580, partial [Candidatus Pacebacteria bacterium]|nr:hypothetical protein [Candidatus Paceibacterota bacterium]